MYYRRNARASRSVVQSLIGSVRVYQCVVNKQLMIDRVITFVRANARTTLRKIVSNFTLKSNIRVKS